MDVETMILQILIAIIGSSAVTTFALWVIFFKWKKEAFLTKLMAERAKNRADRWETMNERIDRQMDIIESLRRKSEEDDENRAVMRAHIGVLVEKVERASILREVMTNHIGVLFRNCECAESEEIAEIRKLYPK